MRPRNIDEPFRLRDCVEEKNEAEIMSSSPGDDYHAHLATYSGSAADSIEALLGEKINEIEALLRVYFEKKWHLKQGSLSGPFSSVDELKKGIGENIPRAFKWTLTRDFDVRLFEVYFITGKHLKDMFPDVAQHSAVSAYPPPPKPLIAGYTVS